jgi:hypothetical protein
VKTRGGKKVVIAAVLAPGAPRAALAFKKRVSSSIPPSDPVNASNNDTMDADAGGKATKRLRKKAPPVVDKRE